MYDNRRIKHDASRVFLPLIIIMYINNLITPVIRSCYVLGTEHKSGAYRANDSASHYYKICYNIIYIRRLYSVRGRARALFIFTTIYIVLVYIHQQPIIPQTVSQPASQPSRYEKKQPAMEEKYTAQQVERVFEKNRAGRLFFTWSQRIPMISSITIRNEREKRGPPPSVTAAIYNRDRPRSHPPSLHSCL